MPYLQIQPSLALASYIKYFWIGEVEAHEQEFLHVAVASSTPNLVFHYKGAFDEVTAAGRHQSFSSGIKGSSTTPAQFASRGSLAIFGVEFYPYALPALFAMPATELSNQYVDLKTFLGNEGAELEEKIFLAHSDSERVQIATIFFEGLLLQPLNAPIVQAIAQIHAAKGLLPIETLAQQFHFSQRQFERLFKETCGFSPKTYSRIVRFESALSQFNSPKSFTDIAHDCGYFDQSHFNRDVKAFTGLQPAEFRKVGFPA